MFHTVAEVAEVSRLSTKTVYKEIRRFQDTKHLRHPKGLKATRPAGSLGWRIRDSDLMKWIEGK